MANLIKSTKLLISISFIFGFVISFIIALSYITNKEGLKQMSYRNKYRDVLSEVVEIYKPMINGDVNSSRKMILELSKLDGESEYVLDDAGFLIVYNREFNYATIYYPYFTGQEVKLLCVNTVTNVDGCPSISSISSIVDKTHFAVFVGKNKNVQ